MMPRRIRVDPLAALAFALGWFLDGEGLIACMIPAALAHELGHLLALRLCRARVHTLRLGLLGAELCYSGALGRGETVLCAAAGPAAGLVYALAACALGGPFLLRSGAASLRVGEATATALVLAGLVLLLRGGGPAPLAAGMWLLFQARKRAVEAALEGG